MITIIIILLSVMVLLFFAFKTGDVFSPWMLTTGVWLAIMVLSLYDTGWLEPIGSQLYTCVIIWVPVLAFFAMAVYYALPSKEYSFVHEDVDYNHSIFMFFFVIAVVCTPYMAYKAYKMVMMFGTENMLANVRQLAILYTKTGDSDGIMKYVNPIDKALYIVALWNLKKVGKTKFIIILLVNLIYALSVMEKSFLFFLFFTTLYILYEKRKIQLRTIAFWCVGILFIFYGFNFARSNVEAEDFSTFGRFFSMYVLSPSVAFGRVQEILSDQFGTRSFTFIYSFADKIFGCDYDIIPKLQEFVWVPIPTNVYTVFQPFYEDFGYKGVAFFASVYGIMCGWFYRVFKNGNQIMRCVYAYIVYVLVLQFFQENLIISISDLFQYIIIYTLMLQDKIHISFTSFFRKGDKVC